MYYHRYALNTIQERLIDVPVVALLGPRQCGKTTLAQKIGKEYPQSIYLDMENPQDMAKLLDPLPFLEQFTETLVIIDEIQLRPNLFSLLRSHVDRTQRTCRILILGSASRDLIRQSSESLAGRISYIELTPFLFQEVAEQPLVKQLSRGMFPLSLLASSDAGSFRWRYDYVRSVIEQELPLLGLQIPPMELRRLLTMMAHTHGELLNAQKIAESLGITGKTFKVHLSYLESAFLIRTLPAHSTNLKKRLVKSPKIYYRDCGIVQVLLSIETYDALLGHPIWGNLWEGYVIEQILGVLDDQWHASFYRTQAGAEIDLILEKGQRRIAIECKSSTAPKVTRGFWSSLEDLKIVPEDAWIIAPISDSYLYKNGVKVGGIEAVVTWILEM